MSSRAEPPEVIRPVNVEPRGSEFDAQPALRQRLDRIAEGGPGRPSNAVEHGRGCPGARNAVESAIVRRPQGYIGRGGQQRLDVCSRQPWGVAAEDQCPRPSRRERPIERGVDSFPELAGALNRLRHGQLAPGTRRLVGGQFDISFAAEGCQHLQHLAHEPRVQLYGALRLKAKARLHTSRNRRLRKQDD